MNLREAREMLRSFARGRSERLGEAIGVLLDATAELEEQEPLDFVFAKTDYEGNTCLKAIDFQVWPDGRVAIKAPTGEMTIGDFMRFAIFVVDKYNENQRTGLFARFTHDGFELSL